MHYLIGLILALCANPPMVEASSSTSKGSYFSQTILTISTDAFPGISHVEFDRDESSGELKALTYTTESGKVTTFTLEQLRQFQLVKQFKGHDAVFLRVESNFTPSHGGHATIRFLQNGLWGTYLNFRMLVDIQGSDIVLRSDPNPKDPESDQNSCTTVFNHLFMRRHTIMGKTAGIGEIVPMQR